MRVYAVPLFPERLINTFESVTQWPSEKLLQEEDYYPEKLDTFLFKPCSKDRNSATNLFVDG